MALGETISPEGRTFQDAKTGVTVRQLTNFRAHSHHLYFTNSGLWDNGKRLLIVSDRNNAANLYSIELESGQLMQLTDFSLEASARLQAAFVNPKRDEVYFILNRDLMALDLHSLKQRRLYRVPDGYFGNRSVLSCTADGSTVCTINQEDLSEKIHMDFLHGYVGFDEYSAARPHCQIVGVPADGGESRVLFEDNFWLNHVNASPTLPDVLTFCHEGPWHKIDQRIWTLKISIGEVRALRKQTPGETVGHEYWFADGQRVGFHGAKDGVHRFGCIRFDGSDWREWDFPYGSTHFHSIDETLIVGDGGRNDPYLLLWRLQNGKYEGPRRLAWHRGSFHIQALHVHPRLSPAEDGHVRVVYTADPQGYGNVYIVEVPEFESLPEPE